MSVLEVLIALAGGAATAMVIAGMILLTPSGSVEVSQERPGPDDREVSSVSTAEREPVAGLATRPG